MTRDADGSGPVATPMEEFRPVLRAGLPDGWHAKESITLLSPDGQANIIASSEPIQPGIESETYAAVQGELLAREFPQYRQLAFEPRVLFGNRQGYAREFEWIPEDGVPVTQIQLYHAADGRGYTATATTPSTNFPTIAPMLRVVLAALVIG